MIMKAEAASYKGLPLFAGSRELLLPGSGKESYAPVLYGVVY